MRRSIALLLGLALFAGAHTVLARSGGGHGGGGHGGGWHSGGGSHFSGQHFSGRSVVVRPAPVFFGRPHFFTRHTVVVGGAVVVAAPLFYPYPYYYPPVYSEPPVYVEQGSGVLYYCPDYRDYYPNVATCPSEWMQVVPDASGYPR